MAKVNASIAAKMQEAGANSYPHEACGLVIKKGRKTLAIQCQNIASAPHNRFEIAQADYISAADEGEVIGVWHTHVEIPPTPSPADRVGCEASEVPWYIVSVRKTGEGFTFSDVEVLQPADAPVDYVGRPYLFGTFDCYTLVVDYYRREFGIEMSNNYPRDDDKWWLRGHDHFSSNFASEGFVALSDATPQPGDVFLIQTGATAPNHAAIYVGDERILHHLHGRLSRHDIYGGHWLKHTVKHLRHKSKCQPQ